MEKKRSWILTLVLQLSLCSAFYLSLNLGQLHQSIFHTTDGITSSRHLDVCFLSVRGGYRPLKQQIHLLKLMEKVANIYKAKFVLNISELGEDDPLMLNASRLFSSMNILWYTTTASKNSKVDCFLEQINITHGKMLTIVGVDTEALQDIMTVGSTSSFENNQLKWLKQKLKAAAKSWSIVVGYHPVCGCEENKRQTEVKQVYEPLHHIFVKFGVNAYVSTQGCINHAFQDGVAYIGIADPIRSKPYFSSLNGSLAFQGSMADGFLLHRVSSLEITTYFVTLTGEVVKKIIIQQRGKEVM